MKTLKKKLHMYKKKILVMVILHGKQGHVIKINQKINFVNVCVIVAFLLILPFEGTKYISVEHKLTNNLIAKDHYNNLGIDSCYQNID